MAAFIATASLGVLIVILGIINMTGNISSLHWYHRQRVTEENRKPFGKLVGLGTLFAGSSLILFGILSFIAEKTNTPAWMIVGAVEVVVGIAVGLGISFYAMFKYNKGIF